MSGRSVHVKIDGRTYAGTFTVDRKMLTVKTTYAARPPPLRSGWRMTTSLTSSWKSWSGRRKGRKGSTL